jgi:hypothetical protein
MAPIEEHGAVWRFESLGQGDQPSWTLVKPADASAPYPAGRSYHAMTTNSIDTIYIHAGCPENGRLSDLWAFNTFTKVWKELAHAPDPPRGGTSITFSHGKLYRMNGFDGSTEQGGSLDVYDIESNVWSTIAYQPDGINGPQPRSVSTLAALKVSGKPSLVTLFGEGHPSSLGHAGAGKMFRDVWIFDIEGQSWSKAVPRGDSPAPRGWFAADVVVDGTVKEMLVVHGGLAEDNSRLGDIWKLELD